MRLFFAALLLAALLQGEEKIFILDEKEQVLSSGNELLGTSPLRLKTGAALHITAPGTEIRGPVELAPVTSVTVEAGSDATFLEKVDGLGGLVKRGCGRLTLTKPVTCESGTVLSEGTLALKGSGVHLGRERCQIEGGDLTFLEGDVTLANPFRLSGDFTLWTEGGSAVLEGDIRGSGKLIKRGIGTVTLSNEASFTGETVVLGGTLILNSRAQRIGTGPVSLMEKGRIAFHGREEPFLSDLMQVGEGAIDVLEGSAELTGRVEGSGTLYKGGAGRLVIHDLSGLEGKILLEEGCLALKDKEALKAISIEIGHRARLALENQTVEASVTLAGDAVIEVEAGEVVLAGLVGGGGSLIKTGKGMLCLRQKGGYAGTTSVREGSLFLDCGMCGPVILEDAATLGLMSDGVVPISVSQNATIEVQNTVALTGALIGSSASLTKTGSGELSLSDIDAFSGTITAKEGKLTFCHHALHENVLVTLCHQTELWLQSQKVPSHIAVEGETAFHLEEGSHRFHSFSGSGIAQKTGPGTILLQEPCDDFTGALEIHEGKLDLDRGGLGCKSQLYLHPTARLSGNGFLGHLVSSGTVFPGHSIGTIEIAGDYTQLTGAVYIAEIDNKGRSDLLDVSGAASLDGTLEVILLGTSYVKGRTYTLLQAEGGISGTWNSTNLGTLPLTLNLIYTPNSILLTVIQNDFFVNKTIDRYNPLQVNNFLETFVTNDSTGLLSIVENDLDSLDSAALTNALDSMQPSIFGALSLLRQEVMSSIFDIVLHTRQVCRKHLFDVWFTPFADTQTVRAYEKKFGGFFNLNKGFQTANFGGAVGFDVMPVDDLLLGISGGYFYSSLRWKKDYGSKGEDNSGFMGPYMHWTALHTVLDIALMGTFDKVHLSRGMQFATVNATATNSHWGYSFDTHIGMAYNALLGITTVKPFFHFDTDILWRQGFTETGAESLNLHVKHSRDVYIRPELGLEVSVDVKRGHHCFRPEVALSWVYIAPLGVPTRMPSFQNYSTPYFDVVTYSKSYNLASLRVGIDARYSDLFKWYGAFRGSLAPKYLSLDFALGFQFDF